MSIEEQRKKLLATNIERYGSEEAYKQSMRERGMKARKVGKGGFYNNPELARKAGSKSKRGSEHGGTLNNTGDETPATESGDKETEA